ncbi:MAG TPA: hypothetical protein VFX76_05615, partial [Roseiflexaceae bacterium]|nr:hypothetical protein [Roseiflexaceae bacterium]
MRRRIAALISLLSVTFIATFAPVALLAQPPTGVPPIIYESPDNLRAAPPLPTSAAYLTVMLQLGDPPALAAPAGMDVAARSRQIVAKQAQLVQNLNTLGA